MKIKKLSRCFLMVLLILGSWGCQKKEQKADHTVLEEEQQEIFHEEETKEADTEAEEAADSETLRREEIEAYLSRMTLEEKVAQMFIITPESLVSGVSCVTAAGNQTKQAFDEIPVGGFIYMGKNLLEETQVQTMLANVQRYSLERTGLPAFLCVDEEGGTVARIGGSGNFSVPKIENMSEIGQAEDADRAEEVGEILGSYLSNLGFNVDFAPVADVLSQSKNTVVKVRSFGSDPEIVSQCSQAVAKGLESQGVYATYKHFPGHGATEGDTHAGYAYTTKTLEELKNCELIPFQEGIDQGISFIMAGHISLPNVIGDDTPASLSKVMIQEILREQMHYDGLVVTDALNMGAVSSQYSSEQAAVKAIQAGADLLLMPADFHQAYKGVLLAVEQGEITEERIDESLRRILNVKLDMKTE